MSHVAAGAGAMKAGSLRAAGVASVALVGFMGAGKTRVGRLVARRLDLPFVDTDQVVTERHGPISEIFAERGEDGFRALERDVAVAELGVATRTSRVVALGGGGVTIGAVRVALARLPHVVWLDAPPDLLFARSRSGTRPLARDEALFEALYARRRPLYGEVATAVVTVARRERPDRVAERVLVAVAL